MKTTEASPPGNPTEFRRQVQDLVALGHLDQAKEFCDLILAKARREQDKDLADSAFCSRAGLSIHQGGGHDDVSKLRRILLSSSNLQNRFNAAYQTSQFHYLVDGDSQRSLFYARQALRYAEELGENEALLVSHNAIGNLLLVDSYFDKAQDAYRDALSHHEPGDSVGRSILLANIGYCQIVTGTLSAGYRTLSTSLRMMRRLNSEGWQHQPHLGLCYACLEVGRYDRARSHAQKALAFAEKAQISAGIKNALYLLGESEKLCGRTAQAYERFHQLQSQFYPENSMVIDLLMAADVRRLINLMA